MATLKPMAKVTVNVYTQRSSDIVRKVYDAINIELDNGVLSIMIDNKTIINWPLERIYNYEVCLEQPVDERKEIPFALETVIFNKFDEASEVIDKLLDIHRTKGYVTVAEYYMLCDLPYSLAMDSNYGWKEFSNPYVGIPFIDQELDGFVVNLPDPILLEVNNEKT